MTNTTARLRCTLLSLALIAACTSDPLTPSTVDAAVGTGLASIGSGAVQPRASLPSSSALPAALKIATLRALQKAPGYDFYSEGSALTAKMGAHEAAATAVVEAGQVEVVPEDASFSLGIRTVHVGRLAEARSVPGILTTHAEGQEVVLARDGVEERYLAGPLGLEQTYRIKSRPPGSGPLVLEIAFEGLAPEPADGSESMALLVDDLGKSLAVYRDVAAIDVDGRELSAHMVFGPRTVALIVNDEMARYPVFVDPLIAIEQSKLIASDGAVGDGFGFSVSLSGETALVGAWNDNSNQGAAYVFVRSGASWTQQAKLTAGDGAPDQKFGISVSLSNETAIIGMDMDFGDAFAKGAAYVFVRSGTSWTQQAKLTAGDGAAGDNFGTAVSSSGEKALIGAYAKSAFTGAAYVFVRSGTSWTQQAKLTAGDGAPNHCFGWEVNLSLDTALVGAPYQASSTGAAYVFARSGTTWPQQAKLTASDGALNDLFGESISVSADTVVIGAGNSSSYTGAAYVFVRSGTIWTQQAKLIASDAAPNSGFGISVSVVGDAALIGSCWSNNQGAAYYFLRSGSSWTQLLKITASDGIANDLYGNRVSLSADTALVGAYGKNSQTGAAYTYLIRGSLGDTCSSGIACHSGFCSDGVCCDSACDAGPCDACSLAAGAVSNGTCALLTGTSCNDGNACTQADTCQVGVCVGASPVTCAASDQCHDAGVCNTGTGVCSNPTKVNGSSCNDGNACTQSDTCQAGVCTGSNPVICTGSDQCHDAGVCNTGTGVCSNPTKVNGSSCNDGNACTQSDTCQVGVCTGASPVTCNAADQCHDAGVCNPSTGVCSDPAKANGSSCNDGSACTQTDTCQAGVCTGSNPVICTGSDQCHDSACNSATGTCTEADKPNGSTCNDGSACTQTDTCQAGVCTGANSVTCTASDQCHDVGVCNTGTGVCSNPPKINGSTCNDGSACTQTDTCQAGVCTGANPVTCVALDQCHNPGVCDPGTGLCNDPVKTNGATCSDGNACTQTDTCQAGVCTGANQVVCTASDQCHNAGACNSSTGVCSDPAKTNGAACNDENGCTQSDTCQSGVCVGSSPVTCIPLDQCHDAGVCLPGTGVCTDPVKTNGSTCSDGNACTLTDSCQAGVCTGTNPILCVATDQCHDEGSCNPGTGVCSDPAKTNGEPCNDGDACTQTDTCQVGVCTGASPVTCTASDQCHDAGICDPATGSCSDPEKEDGSVCDDGDECTRADTCQAGACTGEDPVVCEATDQCHEGGTCNPDNGVCDSPAKQDDEPCDDGNLCTQTDTCQDGSCNGTPIQCTAPDECHEGGTCNPATGECTPTPMPDGTTCAAGNCQAGVCTAPEPTPKGGCDCTTSGGAPESLAPALLVLSFLVVRRRRRASGRREE